LNRRERTILGEKGKRGTVQATTPLRLNEVEEREAEKKRAKNFHGKEQEREGRREEKR